MNYEETHRYQNKESQEGASDYLCWRCLLCDLVFVVAQRYAHHAQTVHGINPDTLRDVHRESGQHTGDSIHEFNDQSGRAVLWLEKRSSVGCKTMMKRVALRVTGESGNFQHLIDLVKQEAERRHLVQIEFETDYNNDFGDNITFWGYRQMTKQEEREHLEGQRIKQEREREWELKELKRLQEKYGNA